MLDDISGLEVVRRVRQKLPKMGIVILSMYGDKQHVLEALRVGANAYVMKKSVAGELVRAIREVLVGHRYLGGQLSDLVVEAYLEKNASSPGDPYDSLSDREREVLHMVANGFTNAEIGESLFISRRTVETHRNNVMRKLNINNQTDVIRYAIQKGIISKDIA
jgi:DNA-binding NarL/FixJ family response regulator